MLEELDTDVSVAKVVGPLLWSAFTGVGLCAWVVFLEEEVVVLGVDVGVGVDLMGVEVGVVWVERGVGVDLMDEIDDDDAGSGEVGAL